MEKTTKETPQVDVNRRRLTRAGLAAPGVLGILASRQVLGAAPYQCTISGQVSGNTSPGGPATRETCVIGDSRSTWLLTLTWPVISRGTLPNSGCQFNGSLVRGTNFNGYLGLINAFYNSAGGGTCNVGTSSSSNPATMLQVLNTDPSVQTGEQFQLGRATVVSLLNSYKYAPNYPVNAATIIEMFNATFNGGTYPASGTVNWSRTQVITYLTSLYPPG
ncbi:MAG TPA: hypothetical protein VEP67_02945 [Thiobacillaceae bacterium]|nr:hypothetical protein [Thiobacillaceae bacterium]